MPTLTTTVRNFRQLRTLFPGGADHCPLREKIVAKEQSWCRSWDNDDDVRSLNLTDAELSELRQAIADDEELRFRPEHVARWSTDFVMPGGRVVPGDKPEDERQRYAALRILISNLPV